MAKTLMLYYTFEGNTGFVAEEAAKNMDVTVERLRVEKEPPKKGLGKFLHGGKSALAQDDPGLLPLENDPADFDTVIVAYPIWAGNYPPAVGAMLKKYSLAGKDLYVIACSASGKAAKSVENLARAAEGGVLRDYLSLVNPLKNKDDAAAKIAEFVKGIR